MSLRYEASHGNPANFLLLAVRLPHSHPAFLQALLRNAGVKAPLENWVFSTASLGYLLSKGTKCVTAPH
jgi:hypothetical protein